MYIYFIHKFVSMLHFCYLILRQPISDIASGYVQDEDVSRSIFTIITAMVGSRFGIGDNNL